MANTEDAKAGNINGSKRPEENANNNENPVSSTRSANISLALGNLEIPLAAKDSEWIGMRSEYVFPGAQIIDSQQSTTVITKLLVGKKADFGQFKQSMPVGKLPTTNQLPAVKEQLKEEYHPSDTDVSISIAPETDSTNLVHITGSDVDNYDEEDDEPKRATHPKKRKKRSDVKVLTDDVSSVSVLPTTPRRKSGSRIRQNSQSKQSQIAGMGQSSLTFSNDADDEYMTQSEDKFTKDLLKKDSQ